MLAKPRLALALVLASGAPAACNSWTTPAGADTEMTDAGDAGSTPAIVYPPDPAGLHVVGNKIENDAGEVIALRGVNRSGTEYACTNGPSIFDGPSDEASLVAMISWHINAVRVPLNESCWLGINGANPASSGAKYKSAIANYVNLLHKYHLTPILELHWTAAGTALARGQQPMPDADHAPSLWADVAATFLADTGVVFELFNEPFPASNRDTDAAWACWRDGCVANIYKPPRGEPPTYQATGMQDLVNAVRATGATQLLLLGGIEYSNNLSQWAAYKPIDPLINLAPAWHIYNFNACSNADCWNSVLTALGSQFPIVATEIGEDDCSNTFIGPLMQLLDSTASGYLAWSWNANGQCLAATPQGPTTQGNPGNPWPLITDYVTATPTSPYAQSFMDHLAQVNP